MTENELQNAFWRATMHCLELDPDSQSQTIQKKVRLSYSLSDDGNPEWEKDEDTTFIQFLPVADGYTDQMDMSHTETPNGYKEQVSYNRCFEITWISYGPNASEIADKIRVGMLRTKIREELAANGIAIKCGLRETVYMPEQDAAGQWWNRYDVERGNGAGCC